MGSYKTDITVRAQKDMREIATYITRELLQPEAAIKTVDDIEAEIKSLEKMPNRFAPVKDERLARQGVRKVKVNNYLVFYDVNEASKIVNILAVLYERMDWKNIL